ncbi:hypothetical protein AAFF_G00343840 [Aldrovandia affinis]|uniref:Uncharacterized protein n=1 Tax=Aldrovandia affinis TaxID=143900 RepID=A0AAD7SK53_9TELE|nr:hypothetical protein AAFF_G00343840 [Aldrovandia affinis]
MCSDRGNTLANTEALLLEHALVCFDTFSELPINRPHLRSVRLTTGTPIYEKEQFTIPKEHKSPSFPSTHLSIHLGILSIYPSAGVTSGRVPRSHISAITALVFG